MSVVSCHAPLKSTSRVRFDAEESNFNARNQSQGQKVYFRNANGEIFYNITT